MSAIAKDTEIQAYIDFLKRKIKVVEGDGFAPPSAPHPRLKPHQVDIVQWAIEKGRAAIFASFGVGKTSVQLQLMKWVHEQTGQKVLIVAPLGVRQEFTRNDGPAMGMDIVYCRTDAEVAAAETPYIITNYERVRDGGITVKQFAGATLDESSCLRSYGSSTTLIFMRIFQDVPYRFVATATPSPNSHKELIHYAGFLGIADTGNLLTRFFQRNSKKANELTLYPHMEQQFWLWMASWALFIHKPSDLGYPDEGYSLPEMQVHWHRLPVDYSLAWRETDSWGQYLLLPDQTGGLKENAKYRRESIIDRIAKAKQLVGAEPDEHWLIWHDLENERHLIEKVIPDVKSVYGSQDLQQREDLIMGFSNGDYKRLSTKPTISGSGCNFQRHCSRAVFVAPSRDSKFNDFIQAIHRVYRFGQNEPVQIHIIYTESQDKEVATLRRKWQQHDELTARMRQIVQTYGLTGDALKMTLTRTLGIDRNEVKGENFIAVNNDCVAETLLMPDDSVDLIVTSIPFSDHYEYSPSINDFGHNDGDEPFFEQMCFLIPQLYRTLKPGRMACIHTKDRIVYGSVSGLGMYSVNEFSDKTVAAFKKAGFVYTGRICVDTDVVRENSQTYRLGWSENANDSTKMGCGSLEYVLLFRKWSPEMSPNGTANGAFPVTKDKETYTRAQWQLEASGIWRDSGDRLLDPHMVESMTVEQLRAFWKQHGKAKVYDYEEHLAITGSTEKAGKLPASFMLFPPLSQNPTVWTDILRIDTLNTQQSRKREESHVCPLQINVIKRLVSRFSNPGDTVLDPFGGIGSTAYQSLKMGRKAISIELNSEYWRFSVGYCEQVENAATVPTLFDLTEFMVKQEVAA